MPGLLTNVPVTDEARRKNDRHKAIVVLLVLAVFSVYLYLFTHVADSVGIPRPQELAARLGITVQHVFDSDRNVDSNIAISLTQRFDTNDDERLVFFLFLAGSFLCVYFVPVACKQPVLVLCAVTLIGLLYGPKATGGLLLAHLAVYLILHPRRDDDLIFSGSFGLLLYYVVFHGRDYGLGGLALAVLLPIASIPVYRFLVLWLLERRWWAEFLPTAVIHSAILTVGVSSLIEGLSGVTWTLPLGLLLFFWQWERLIMYHVDYKDGSVPRDLRFYDYLAVFFHPGAINNWNWGVTIGQGYAYVRNSFLCQDKNRLVLSGLKMMGIALCYLLCWDWIRHFLVSFFESHGVAVHNAYTRDLVWYFVDGGAVTTRSVLATTFLDLCRWTMIWGGVVHFKVGLWRLFGYRVDPYFNRPWLSTNLVTFWTRFTFHYREFLVRAFYFPVFFRFFRKHRNLRVITATMAAAGVGNLVWGHIPERIYYQGMEYENLSYVLGTWPYFLFLGVGIGLTQIYLLHRKRRRKPWTWDRWILGDFVAAYATLQFFALITIFARPVPESTVGDLFRLFWVGFGIN